MARVKDFTNIIRANELRRQQRNSTVLQVLVEAGESGLTTVELAATTGFSLQAVRTHLAALRKDGKAHVCTSCNSGRFKSRADVWRAGPGAEAAPAEQASTPEEDDERDIEKAIKRSHASWIRDWTPRRPQEAAWI